jgi:hypothetical protein
MFSLSDGDRDGVYPSTGIQVDRSAPVRDGQD